MPPARTHPYGARARSAREALGLRQAEVAERIAISIEVYGRFERGLVTPRIATLLRLCRVLGITPDALLLGDTPPRAAPPPAAVRELLAVLDGADDVTVRRVTEVARWLRPRSHAYGYVVPVSPGMASTANEPRPAGPGTRPTPRRRSKRRS